MRRGKAGIEPTPACPNGAGYARLNLSATAGINIREKRKFDKESRNSVKELYTIDKKEGYKILVKDEKKNQNHQNY